VSLEQEWGGVRLMHKGEGQCVIGAGMGQCETDEEGGGAVCHWSRNGAM
jgi:hypothetical protein